MEKYITLTEWDATAYLIGKAKKNASILEKDESVTRLVFADDEIVGDVHYGEVLSKLFPNVKEFGVKEGSVYLEEGGVLFNKIAQDTIALCAVPWGLSGTYTVTDFVTRITTFAFYNSSLSDVTLPEGLLSLDPGAFYGCDHISEIALPVSLKEMGSWNLANPFEGCKKLKKINVVKENQYFKVVDGVLYNNLNQLLCYPAGRGGHMVIPAECHAVGVGAFCGCNQLTSVALHGDCSVGNNAFQFCTGLREITLPVGVKWLGRHVFAGCTALQKIYIEDSAMEFSENFPFAGCSKNLCIYGHAGSETESYARRKGFRFEQI